MKSGRAERRLRRALHIRAGEGGAPLLLFSYFFLLAAPLTIIKSLRTADFLAKMGVGALPIAYLGAAVVTGLVVFFYARVQFRASLHAVISGSLVFFAVSGLLLDWALRTRAGILSPVLPYGYWIWASLLVVALMTHFWMTVNEMFTPREARRLMRFLTTGGVLGSVLGGLLVGFLSRTALAGGLLPLACFMLLACVLVVRGLFKAPHESPAPAGDDAGGMRKAGLRASFDAVRRNKFLSLIAGLVAVSVIVSTCIEFQFLSAAYGRFISDRNALQAFFGFFDPALTLFTLCLNIIIGGYLLKNLDAARALLLTPGALLAGSLAVLCLPFGLFPGILIKGTDESMAFAVNQPAREILYIPVSAPLRHKAKPFIEMFISQVAKVIGALVLLAFALALNKRIEGFTPVFDSMLARDLSWVVIVFLVPWAVLSLKAGKGYLATLRGNIHPLWDRAEKELAEKLDVGRAKLVFDTIDSRNYSSVLYALHLFDLLAQDKLTPDVKNILAEKAGEVRAAAIADRFEAEGTAQLSAVLDDLPPEDVLTEIPIIMSSAEYQQVMEDYFEKVRGESPGAEVKRMELAKAIGLMSPDSLLASRLPELIDDDSPRVSCLALKSAARLRREDALPAIIRKLGNALTVEDAADALEKYGDRAAEALDETLRDQTRELALRRAAAGVLGRIGTQPAGLALAGALEHGPGDLDPAVIDALDRIRSEHEEITVPRDVVGRKTFDLIRAYCRTYIDLQGLGPGADTEALRHGLAGNLYATLADIFKLLGLSYSQKDIRTAYQNISTGHRHAAGHAVEWLDNTLKKDVKEVLLPIVEDLDPEEKTRRIEKVLRILSQR